MTANDFIKHVCPSCGAATRLVIDGFDVIDALLCKDKCLVELEAENKKLRALLVARSKNPKVLFGKIPFKAVEKWR